MSDAHGRDHVTHVELALDAAGQVPRAQGVDDRQYGRLSVDLRDLHPDLSLRDPARRHLHDPGDLRRDQGGVHQHRAGRRLSRRRAARRRRSCWSASSISRPTSWGSTRPSCAAATSSRPTPIPYQTPVALQYDSGDYQTTLDLATEGGRLRRVRGAARRRRRGAANCAASASPPISRPAASRPRRWSARSAPAPGCSRAAAVRVHPTGSVTILTGSHSHGQGHETTFAQLVSDAARHPDRD